MLLESDVQWFKKKALPCLSAVILSLSQQGVEPGTKLEPTAIVELQAIDEHKATILDPERKLEVVYEVPEDKKEEYAVILEGTPQQRQIYVLCKDCCVLLYPKIMPKPHAKCVAFGDPNRLVLWTAIVAVQLCTAMCSSQLAMSTLWAMKCARLGLSGCLQSVLAIG